MVEISQSDTNAKNLQALWQNVRIATTQKCLLTSVGTKIWSPGPKMKSQTIKDDKEDFKYFSHKFSSMIEAKLRQNKISKKPVSKDTT